MNEYTWSSMLDYHLESDTDMKPKVYSYIRFSSPEQAKGDSKRRQLEAGEKWCQDHNIEPAQRYEDLGKSAYHGKNAVKGDLSRFLKLVQCGKIPRGSYLIVENLDRLSRDQVLEADALFKELIRSDIKVVTLNDGMVYDKESIARNWTSLIIVLATMARAHEESKLKGERVAAAWDRKRKAIPTGVKLTAKGPAWLRLSADRRNYLPIPERVVVVKRIFEMAAAGKGRFHIARTLTAEGTPTFTNRKGLSAWYPNYIRQLLVNRRVIGEYAPGIVRENKVIARQDVVKDYYPSIIDKTLFATVQQILKARSCDRGRSDFNVFSRLAFDVDGVTMYYVNKDRRRGWHYLVSSAAVMGETKNGAKVPYHAWPYDDFLRQFLSVCEHAALQRVEPSKQDVDGVALKREELSEIVEKINRVTEYLASGEQSFSVVTAKLDSLHREKAALDRTIADLENRSSAKATDLSQIDWTDREALKENLRATVQRIMIDVAARRFAVQFLSGQCYEYLELPNGDREIRHAEPLIETA